MESNPDIQISKLTDALTMVNSRYTYGDPEEIHHLIESKVRGVRIERAFEDIMSSQEYISCRRGTIQEDRKGIDFVLTLPGIGDVNVDIKSSLDQVAAQNGGYGDVKAYSIDARGHLRLFPLMNDSSFENDSCRIKEASRSDIQGGIFMQLHQAMVERSQKKAGKHLAHAA